MSDIVLKVKFPSSSPVITKSFKLPEHSSVKDAIQAIRENMKQTLAVTSSHALFLPNRNLWLSESLTLAEIRHLLNEEYIELIDRSETTTSPYVYGAVGFALGVVISQLFVRYVR